MKRYCVECRERGYSSGLVTVVNGRGDGFCETHRSASNIELIEVTPEIDLDEVARRGVENSDRELERRGKNVWAGLFMDRSDPSNKE